MLNAVEVDETSVTVDATTFSNVVSSTVVAVDDAVGDAVVFRSLSVVTRVVCDVAAVFSA